jgi:hypothetical protein
MVDGTAISREAAERFNGAGGAPKIFSTQWLYEDAHRHATQAASSTP